MMEELARRAVACRHWRWMTGMRSIDSNAYKWRNVSGAWIGEGHAIRTCRGQLLPDFTDPATVGCLLALVREAWDVGYGENKYAYIAVNPPVTPHMDEPWSVVVCDHNGEWPFGFDGDTEAEALIEALEAAP